MKLRFAPRALREAKRKKSWWLTNRPSAPDVFEHELRATLDEILAIPTLGAEYPSHFTVPIRRVLMKKTGNHVYGERRRGGHRFGLGSEAKARTEALGAAPSRPTHAPRGTRLHR